MKNSIGTFLIAAALVLLMPSCGSKDSHHDHNADGADSTKISYTCPMHPEVVSDKPGTCSKCGMELVKVEELKAADHGHMHNDSTHHD